MTFQLRDYQNEAVSETYNWFRNNDGNCLIVLPTASGKSLVSAKINYDAMQWPNNRVLNLVHVHELVSQNFLTLKKLWPEAPAGIYCAGLGKKQHHHPITYASIQSVYRKPETIGFRDLILVDEVQLISDDEDGMYRTFLAHMKLINPNVKVIGLSATIFRTKTGYLHKGERALFSGISYEVPILRLVKEGYLCPLISKVAETQGNTDNLAIQAGEFSVKEAKNEFDRIEMTKAAVDEMIAKGSDRRSWLVFCVTIEHAEHVQQELESRGITSAVVSHKTPKQERERIRNSFDKGTIKAVCNVAVWTVGLDVVPIDMIVLLRPTMSPGLLVQMLGRGMRPIYAAGADLTTVEGRIAGIGTGSKPNCLVLDMAMNLARLGPITHICVPDGERKTKRDRDGKMCLNCRSINPFDATECIDCGKLFEGGAPRKIKHSKKASTAEVMSESPTMGEASTWFQVRKILYEVNHGNSITLRVTYDCKPNYISEFLCFGHEKRLPRNKADSWWVSHGGNLPCPLTAEEALGRLNEISGIKIKRIKARKDGRFDRIDLYDLANEQTKISLWNGNLGKQGASQVWRNSDDDPMGEKLSDKVA